MVCCTTACVKGHSGKIREWPEVICLDMPLIYHTQLEKIKIELKTMIGNFPKFLSVHGRVSVYSSYPLANIHAEIEVCFKKIVNM